MFKLQAIVASALLIFVITTATAGDRVYKWKDANGKIQYTESKPADGIKYTIINYISSKAGTKSTTEKNASSETDFSPEDEILAKQKAEQKRADRANQTLDQKNCEISTNNFKVLENRVRVQTQDEDGNRRLLTDDERAERLAKAKENMSKYCK